MLQRNSIEVQQFKYQQLALLIWRLSKVRTGWLYS